MSSKCISIPVARIRLGMSDSAMFPTAFHCTTCAIFFDDAASQRVHYKTPFHLYNSKRRNQLLDPIDEHVWVEKLRLIESNTQQASESYKKGTDHLKPRPDQDFVKVKRPVEDRPLVDGEIRCLFSQKIYPSLEQGIKQMEKDFSFFIPYQEELKDLPGLIDSLREKIEDFHVCIYCDQQFADLHSVRCHMLDKRHTMIGTDEDVLLDDIEDFYNWEEEDQVQPILNEDGTLSVSGGKTQLISREFAYIYKQYVPKRDAASSDLRGNLRSQYLMILGGSGGDSKGLSSLPDYQLKRMTKKVLREQRTQYNMKIRVELRKHKTTMMQSARPQVVEMYSYGK
jgi:C2H2 type zinc-finger (2 copies)